MSTRNIGISLVRVVDRIGIVSERKGSRVGFPAEEYIIILEFSLTERCSHPGEDHTNEIKHDIYQE